MIGRYRTLTMTIVGLAILGGNAFGQGFTGNFSPSKWQRGSNPPWGNLVDTSGAPTSITMKNYPDWGSSGSAMSIKNGVWPGTIYFKYSTTGTTANCPATKQTNDSTFVVLPPGNRYDSLSVQPNQTFGFALNGLPLPGKGSCLSTDYSKISLTISEISFVHGSGPRPVNSDTTIIGMGGTGCGLVGGLFAGGTCTLTRSLAILEGKTLIVNNGITLDLAVSPGATFTNAGTFVNNGKVRMRRRSTNNGVIINAGAFVIDSAFTTTDTLKLLAGGTLFDTSWYGGLYNTGVIQIMNNGSKCPSCTKNAIQSYGIISNNGSIHIRTSDSGTGIHLNNLGNLNIYSGSVTVANTSGVGIYLSGDPTLTSPSRYFQVTGGKMTVSGGVLNIQNTGGYGVFNARGTRGGHIANERWNQNSQGTVNNSQDSTGIYNQAGFLNCALYTGLRPLVPNDMISIPAACPPDRN
jgi:hypothetical protein